MHLRSELSVTSLQSVKLYGVLKLHFSLLIYSLHLNLVGRKMKKKVQHCLLFTIHGEVQNVVMRHFALHQNGETRVQTLCGAPEPPELNSNLVYGVYLKSTLFRFI